MQNIKNNTIKASIMKQSAPSTVRTEGLRFLAGANFGSNGVAPSGWLDILGKAAKGALGGVLG